MKKVLFTFILGLLISLTNIQAQWTQIGQDIEGKTGDLRLGKSVSLSSDGSVVAVGVKYGAERIYKNIGGTWTQIGQDIEGVDVFDHSGNSVSLNSDGSVIAIGSPFDIPRPSGESPSYVRIYKNIGGIWTKIGNTIYGKYGFHDLKFGWSVSLSSDGDIVAIGSITSYSTNGNVRVYKNVGGNWTQIGQTIEGETSGDKFGWSVSISSDGSIVAISAPYNDGNGLNSGHVRIFKNIDGTWTQIGQDIDGESDNDKFGWSVSLSSDGAIVAIGAPRNDGNGTDSGHVRIYKNIDGTWTQIGQNIEGEETKSYSGYSVSINSDGSMVAIGAPKNSGNGFDSGQVRIYKNIDGTWTQVRAYINGGVANERSGYTVSLSADGSIVAIGAPQNGKGNVRVFQNAPTNISELKEAGISIYPNPSAGIFNIKNAKDYDITITDITGKIIYRTTATANEQVRLQQSGVYIVNFKSQTKSFSSKIIVK